MRRIAVRAAAAGDLEAAASVAAERSATKWTFSTLRGELSRPDAVFLVAVDGPSLLGYAVARAVDGELRLLDIASAVDGEGAGRALWAGLVEAGRRRGLKKLTLEVSLNNLRAREFYLAAGAVEAGRRPRFYPDGSDAVLMDAAI